MLCSHFLVTSNLFLVGCLSLIIRSQTMQSLFCLNNVDNWESVVYACRNVNRGLFSVEPCLNQLSYVLFGCTVQCWNNVVLVWCCVFCLKRRVVIKFTSCWVMWCQVHTPCTTESPVCSLYFPLIPFIFHTCGIRTVQNERSMPLNNS